MLGQLKTEARHAMLEASAQGGEIAETVYKLANTVMNLVECLQPIERVLIAQLIDQRDRLNGELNYVKCAAIPNETRIQRIADRLATVNQQLEELGQ